MWWYTEVIQRVQWQFLARDEGDVVSSTKPGSAARPHLSTEPGLGRWDADLGQLHFVTFGSVL